MEKQRVIEAVNSHSKTILRVAYTYLRNVSDAEDISQDVFLSLLECRKIFHSDEHLKAWLIRTTINKCKNVLKSGWKSKRSDYTENSVGEATRESSYDRLHEAIGSLDERYRITLHLHYFEGYSIREISGIMKKPPSTICSYLHRGRKQLKEVLADDGYVF